MTDHHEHHGHDHAHGHHHAISADADRRYLSIALLLLLGFMAVEIIVGIMASSLALISDAGHMLTDAGAIGLALFAMHWASRPAHGQFTFGFQRAEILSALANGLTLLILAVWFIIAAVIRLIHPPQVEGTAVMIIALVGIVVNLLAVFVMSKANRQSLNVEGSFQHILTDLYAFIATAIAGGLIWLTGWNRLDALAALVVAALMARAGFHLVRDAGYVFLEASPRHLNPQDIRNAICHTEDVTGINDLHVWEVTSGFPALAAHVFVDPAVDCHIRRRQLETMLLERFDIKHTTLQMDHAQPGEVTSGCTVCDLDDATAIEQENVAQQMHSSQR